MTKQQIRHILAEHKRKAILNKHLAPAAVLVPLFCQEENWHILFTQRSQKVVHHKGQISFPGGNRMRKDKSPLDTALRESHEEIGLKAEDVEILGELDDSQTISGFVVTPFVGVIPQPYPFKISRREIDEVFAVPLSTLANKDNLSVEVQDAEDWKTSGYFYHYQDKVIWGATARILTHFLELLYPGFSPGSSL